VAQSLVFTSISLPDLTLISDLGDEPSPTLEDAGLAIGPLPTDMEVCTPTATLDADTMPIPHLPSTQDQDTNITLQIPSLVPNVVTGPTASDRHTLPLLTVGIPGEESLPFGVPLPPLMSCTKVTYDTEQSESALSESWQDDVEPSLEGMVMSEAVGSDIGPAAALPKGSNLGTTLKLLMLWLLSPSRHIGPGSQQNCCLLYAHNQSMLLRSWQPGQSTKW